MDRTIVEGPRTLFYRTEGSGLPVLLLHGFAEDGAIWNNQVACLAAHYRLIIPDLPGSGRSSALLSSSSSTLPGGSSSTPSGESLPAPSNGVSIERLAESVIELLNQEGIETCVLIGHSMGGYISLAVAEKYPERLSALGLFHSTAYDDSEEKKAARQKGITFIRKNGAAAFIRQSTPNLFGEYTRTNRPDLITNMVEQYSGFSSESLVSYYEAMIRRPDRTAVLQQFAGPVLFVIGREDSVIPMEQTLRQCHLPAIAHIHTVEHAGHEGMLENPDRSNKILHSFLNFVLQA